MKQAVLKKEDRLAALASLKDEIIRKNPEARFVGDRELIGSFKFGLDQLDSIFDYRFPRGQLIELSGGISSGKTSLLFNILTETTRRQNVLLIDFSSSFFPAAYANSGINLDNLLLCKPDDSAQGLLIAERLIRKKMFGLIVLDLAGQRGKLNPTLLHRIRIETVRNRAQVIFVTDPQDNLLPSSLMSLRLSIKRNSSDSSDISLTKSRLSAEGITRTFLHYGIPQSGQRTH